MCTAYSNVEKRLTKIGTDELSRTKEDTCINHSLYYSAILPLLPSDSRSRLQIRRLRVRVPLKTIFCPNLNGPSFTELYIIALPSEHAAFVQRLSNVVQPTGNCHLTIPLHHRSLKFGSKATSAAQLLCVNMPFLQSGCLRFLFRYLKST